MKATIEPTIGTITLELNEDKAPETVANFVKYAKDGTWDADRLGNFVISGGHVKFFRKDFLQKCGFLEPEKEEDPTTEMLQMLGKLLEGQTTIMRALRIMIDYQIKEKTADAATPTD